MGLFGCSSAESDDAASSAKAPDESAQAAFESVDDRPAAAVSDVSDGGGLGSMMHTATGVVQSIDCEREIVIVSVTDGAAFVIDKVVTIDFSKHNGPMYEIDDVREGSTVEFDFLYDGTEPDGVLGGQQIVVI